MMIVLLPKDHLPVENGYLCECGVMYRDLMRAIYWE